MLRHCQFTLGVVYYDIAVKVECIMSGVNKFSGSASARYFAIKRFAVHDGPGIRTTLFLKGCSLRCLWCHNPEGIPAAPELAFHEMKCVNCGRCADACPQKLHQVGENGHTFDRAKCTVCGQCADACPQNALEILGKTITVDEAVKELAADRIFYGDTGGVTLSGGEPLLQSTFCAELLKRLEAENIHGAVDTSGNVPWAHFAKVLPFADLYLYDFKVRDSEKHRRFTGCGNELILDNLRRLDAAGKAVEIRMPLVPGLNLGDDDLRGAAEFLAPLRSVTAVRLLAYHAFARSKYRAQGKTDTMPDVPPPSPDELARAAEILNQAGLRTILPDPPEKAR